MARWNPPSAFVAIGPYARQTWTEPARATLKAGRAEPRPPQMPDCATGILRKRPQIQLGVLVEPYDGRARDVGVVVDHEFRRRRVRTRVHDHDLLVAESGQRPLSGGVGAVARDPAT